MYCRLYIFLFIIFFNVYLEADEIFHVTDTEKLLKKYTSSVILFDEHKEQVPNYVELEKNLVNDFSEILHSALHSNPSAASIIYKKRDNILFNLVNSLQIGAHLVKGEDIGEKSSEKERKKISYDPILIDSNKIIYARLDSLDSDILATIHEKSCAIMRYARKPNGMILDLRNCRDTHPENAVKILSMFKEDEELFESKDFKNIKPFLFRIKLPLIVIIGSETKGSPEIFASLIKNFSGIVSIGTKSSGTPFPLKKIKLKSGITLNVPIIPEALAAISPYSVEPDIDIDPIYPVIPFEKFSKGVKPTEDKAINRAAEILLCLHALTKKKKQSRQKN